MNNKFQKIIMDVMSKIGVENELKINVAEINDIDRNVIIDELEDAGYKVDTSYGSDELVAYK